MTTVDHEAARAEKQRLAEPRSEGARTAFFEHGVPVRAVVALVVLANLLARGFAPALPGLAVGIESYIALAGRVAAVLSMVAVAGALAAMARLTARSFDTSRLDVPYRVMAVPGAICASVLAVAAVFQGLSPNLSLVLAFATAGPLLLAAPLALRRAETRAAGLVLALAGAAGLLHVVGRAVALHAAEEASVTGFRVAQWLETFATVIDVSTLGVVGAYVWRRSSTRTRAVLCATLLAGLFVVFVASGAREPDAPWWRVLPGRMLDQFLRNPAPFIPEIVLYAVEVTSLALVVVALALHARLGAVSALFAACIAGRAAADIPVPALSLLLAGLMTPYLLDSASRAVSSR